MACTLAITGSIGAGKTEVAKFLNDRGVTIIDADDITHNILRDDLSTIKLITSHFGGAILSETGSIDRKKLREIVFKNSDEKAWLENVMHPIIRKKIREKQESAHGDNCALIIPLLNEKNIKHYDVDLICKVKTNREIQVQRLISRDNIKYEEAERIIEDHELKNDLEADFIINNNGNIEQLEQEIKKLQKVINKMKSREKKQGLDNNFFVMMSLILMVSLLPSQIVGGYGIIEHMANDLGITANIATTKLFITFGLGLTIGELIIGPLSDRFGRLPIFIIFLNIFSISSLLCSLFISPAWFQFFRFISGFTIASGIIISRAIISDNSNMTGGTRTFSLVSAISYIVVASYPFFINAAINALDLEWSSFFVFNAIFCSTVSAVTFNLLNSLKDSKNKQALKPKKLLKALKSTVGNPTYRIALYVYIAVVFVESIEEFFMPIILLDHLGQTNHLINLMRGAATGVIGAIALYANAKMVKLKFNPVSISVVASIILASVAVIMSLLFTFINDKEILLIIYITLYLVSLSCVLIAGLNIFMITSQTVNKKKVGAGFITSLTVSLWGFSSFIASYALKFINNMSLSQIINIYTVIAVLTCVAWQVNKNTLKDMIKNC